tara:strand:- start:166 stop:459 length:294 start_codon:yes stop_codon:yes gene_type:complete
MRLIDSLKKRKFVLLNIFLGLYVVINFVGGERGLISYFDKKNIYNELKNREQILSIKLEEVGHKISLIKKNDIDYLDMNFREKFRYGKQDEIIIKIK